MTFSPAGRSPPRAADDLDAALACWDCSGDQPPGRWVGCDDFDGADIDAWIDTDEEEGDHGLRSDPGREPRADADRVNLGLAEEVPARTAGTRAATEPARLADAPEPATYARNVGGGNAWRG